MSLKQRFLRLIGRNSEPTKEPTTQPAAKNLPAQPERVRSKVFIKCCSQPKEVELGEKWYVNEYGLLFFYIYDFTHWHATGHGLAAKYNEYYVCEDQFIEVNTCV